MDMTTVGTGPYTYELVEDWAHLPAGWTLGQTGIVTDARDRVYLFNRSAHPLIVLEQDGTFLTSWGEGVLSSAHGMGIDAHENLYLPVINAHGVWVHTDGRVLVADRENNRIQIFAPDGEFLTQWRDLARPCDIYIDHEGVVYVPELDGLITLLTLDGQVLTRWTSPTTTGAGDGGHAVWVDSRGDIYLNQNQEGRRLLKYRRCTT